VLLAANPFSALFDPLVHALTTALVALHNLIPNYGWALIIMAAVVRILLWPLSEMQFRSMAEMQKVQPLMKQLQAKYKNDPQTLNQKTMELYREHKVNPLAGCVPMLIQLPILFGMFYAIQAETKAFAAEHWLWIGSTLSEKLPSIFATSLAKPDYVLLAVYAVSMYFTIRYSSPPSSDPQQAQTQKIMAILSPAMIAFFGFKQSWASAFYIYWFALNVFSVAQQMYMYRRHGLIGPKAAQPAPALAAPAPSTDGAKKQAAAGGPSANGKRTYRPKKRARR